MRMKIKETLIFLKRKKKAQEQIRVVDKSKIEI